MDKIALGRQGEIYVLQKLIENGWNLSNTCDRNCEGLDWIFKKNDKEITVQVKTSKKNIITFGLSKRTFNYLIVTNLKELFIIPIGLLNKTNRLSETLKKTNGHYELLDKEGKDLLSAIHDCGISYSNVNTSNFF